MVNRICKNSLRIISNRITNQNLVKAAKHSSTLQKSTMAGEERKRLNRHGHVTGQVSEKGESGTSQSCDFAT